MTCTVSVVQACKKHYITDIIKPFLPDLAYPKIVHCGTQQRVGLAFVYGNTLSTQQQRMLVGSKVVITWGQGVLHCWQCVKRDVLTSLLLVKSSFSSLASSFFVYPLRRPHLHNDDIRLSFSSSSSPFSATHSLVNAHTQTQNKGL